MTWPTLYDPHGLSPKVEIYDHLDVLQKTYVSSPLGGTPQNFELAEWSLHAGVNTDHGSLVLIIHDDNKAFYDFTNARLPSIIDGRWKVKLYLGQTAADMELWFTGYIGTIKPFFDTPDTMDLRIFCVGQGVKISEYKTVLKFFQKKIAGGEVLDDADTDAYLSNLVVRLISTNSHFPLLLDALAFTTTGVDTIEITIPDLQANFQSIGQVLQELANIAVAYYGVDPSGDFWFRRGGNTFSGFLVCNDDWNDVTLTNWDPEKVCFLTSNLRSWEDDLINYGYAFFNGIGAHRADLDVEHTVGNATVDLSSKYFAFRFEAAKNKLYKVAPFLSKTGTVTKDLTVSIVGGDPADATLPNPVDTRIAKLVPGGQLQTELTSSKYFEVNTNSIQVTPNSYLWILFKKYEDATNYIGCDYQTATGVYADSTDGINWTTRTGQIKFRSYAAKLVHVLVENVNARVRWGDRQLNVPLSNYKSYEAALVLLGAISKARGKMKRTFESIHVTVPSSRMELGQTLRFHDDRTGLDMNVNLIGFNISGSANSAISNMGAMEMESIFEGFE